MKADASYASAVEWASAGGIVNGYGSGTFGPEDPVTREQLAAILYRYVKSKGFDVKTADLKAADADSISEWAVEAVRWAAANGILKTDARGKIRPGDPVEGTGILNTVRVILKGK